MSAPSPSGTPWSNPTGIPAAPARFWAGAKAGTRLPAHAHDLRWPQIASFAADLFFVCASAVAVFYLRFFASGYPPWRPEQSPVEHYLGFVVLYAALVGVFCQNQGLYRRFQSPTPLDEGFSALKAVILATLFLTAFIYLSGDKSISRLVVGFTGVLSALTLSSWRFCRSRIVKQRVVNGQNGRNVLIIGAGNVGQALARHFEENKHLGYVVKGFLDDNHSTDPRMRGKIEDFARVACAEFVDEVFVTIPSERQLVAQVMLEARQQHLDVKVVPELFDGLAWRTPIHYVGDFPVMELLREPIPAFGLFIKRLLDVTVSSLGFIALAPALAVLAIAIKLDSPGPVIYSSERVGRKGQRFRCCKLRTMVANADHIKRELWHLNERDGPLFKMRDDPRITRLGRFLRRYSLDELPQLWNVLRGEMSLVGPRPHPVDEYQRYQLEHLRRLDVKPGVTGLWQVYARQNPSFERNMALDLEYIENWNLWIDLKILLKTLPVALSGSGS
jgi:exopolysaccharide biosynthesis polyprenyl glycosylphosphotransferase